MPIRQRKEDFRIGQNVNLDNYDLYKLGWKSFQQLCLTVVGEVWGQTVESFHDSHDGGRDGAFTGSWNGLGREGLSGLFAIQCKHTSRAGHSIRESDLSTEFDKARKLVADGLCDSYVLMTNATLTGVEEGKIRSSLRAVGVKYIGIFGQEWINQQIVRHQNLRMLVPRVYGLGDLSQIMDGRKYEQSKVILQRMRVDLDKFVATDAYVKAARALIEHGFVLLIGEPAAGKSTLASLLAVVATDLWGVSILKLDRPEEVSDRWNPLEPSQLIRVDDAFGMTQYEISLARDWNRTLTNLDHMLSTGTRMVMTLRDYIYNRARKDLKTSAYPLFNESKVVIDVQEFSSDEKRQILYNHMKLGKQPGSFRRRIKPYLEGVAAHSRFIPEMARRLADPAFTNSLRIDEKELDHFMEKREDFLRDVLGNLDIDSQAALALIFMRNGNLESPIRPDPSESEAFPRLGSDIGRIGVALQAMKGSLVVYSDSDNETSWQISRPTIGDSYAKVLAENPEHLDIFVRGSTPQQLIRQVTCGNVELENAVVVPRALFPLMLAKLDEISSSGRRMTGSRFRIHRALLGFLSSRCSKEFLSMYIWSKPSLLDEVSSPGLFLSAVPEVGMAKRLHKFGLLPDQHRKTFVETVSDYLLQGEDGGALDESEAKSLFIQSEFDDLILRVRQELLPRLGDVRREWQYNHDSDIPPNDYMQPLIDLFDLLKAQFQDEHDLVEIIDREEGYVDQWVGEHLEEAVNEKTNSFSSFTGRATLSVRNPSDRSIFDDVDEA